MAAARLSAAYDSLLQVGCCWAVGLALVLLLLLLVLHLCWSATMHAGCADSNTAGANHPHPNSLLQAVGRSRSLRAACPRLLSDILAVLSGLRPGFLLDYGQLSPEQLAAAAAQLAAALGLAVAGLVVAVLNDCCYLVQTQLLPVLEGGAAAAGAAASSGAAGVPSAVVSNSSGVAAGTALSAPPAMFVAFEQQRVRWAAAEAAAQAAAQLEALRRGLLEAAGGQQQGAAPPAQWAASHPHTGCGNGGSGSSRAASSAGIPVVEAEAIAGWRGLVAPTASGYLLGYPALYLCQSAEGAQAAARCLSSSSLCLHSVGCQLRADSGAPAPDPPQPLLAFSVPRELAAAAGWAACRDAWWAQLRRRHRAAVEHYGVPWDEARLEVASHAPRPVAL